MLEEKKLVKTQKFNWPIMEKREFQVEVEVELEEP